MMPAPARTRPSEFDPLPNARPLTLAHAFLNHHGYAAAANPAKPLTLRHWQEELYRFDKVVYRKVDAAWFEADLITFLNEQHVRRVDADGKPAGSEVLNVLPKVVTAVQMQLRALCQARIEAMPNWLDEHRPARENVIAFRNGWVDIGKYLAGEQRLANPPTPFWFSENVIPHDFTADATCPRWLAFLDEVLDADPERIQLLQEWFGYCLTTDTRKQKMLWLHGPPGVGKGTILRALANMIGDRNVASPQMSSLADKFGLESLLGKTIALMPDAHLGRNDDAVAVLDRILAITGNDPVDVQRKYLKSLNSVRLPVRFSIGINNLPTLPDPSGAIRRRTLLIPFLTRRHGKEDTTLDERFQVETPGIVRWALEGLRSLRIRDEFVQPQAGADVIDRLCRLANPLAGFVEEKCVVGEEMFVGVDDLYDAYEKWARKNGNSPKSKERFGEDLRQTLPGQIKKARARDGQNRFWRYDGIGLDTEVPY